MKYFACGYCKNQIFFEHTICPHCQHILGYSCADKEMLTFKPDGDVWQSLHPDSNSKLFKPCFNYTQHRSCNWVLPADHTAIYCESCRLTHTIPDLSIPDNLIYWRRIEKAKRRFLYLAQQLNMMPYPKRHDDDHLGLRFHFLMPSLDQPVLTGHAQGSITLNASEADVVYRETTRIKMGENYRTLLGHFRHESGHYYFELIQALHPELIDEFRHYFGDERQNYSQALKRHYENGPPDNWAETFVSSYASTHPWEDWAETWAHYLHMMDTLETAYYAGLVVRTDRNSLNNLELTENPIGAKDFEQLLQHWKTLTFNLNALNRSMGLDDAYPFTLTEAVLDKLRFIHHQLLSTTLHPTDKMPYQNHQPLPTASFKSR